MLDILLFIGMTVIGVAILVFMAKIVDQKDEVKDDE